MTAAPGTGLVPGGAGVAYEADAGDGPALVLLAGQANDRHWWDRARPDFAAAGLRTVVLDWRGTGSSSLGEAPLTTADLAEDVVAVLDDLGIGRAHVYGTSMGGRVAQWVAVDHPDRVCALVLGCTAPGGPRSLERSQILRRRLAQADADTSRQLLTDLMYTPAWQAANPGPYATTGDPTMTPAATVQHLRASNGHDVSARLGSVEAPTLVLHGTDDELSPVGNASLLAELIPHATVELFTGARHAYFDEARPRASRAVIEFLGRTG